MIRFIATMQILLVVTCWLPVIAFRGSLWRWTQRKGRACDKLCGSCAALGFAASTFPARWLLQPAPIADMPTSEVATWGALHVLMIVAVLAMTLAVSETASASK